MTSPSFEISTTGDDVDAGALLAIDTCGERGSVALFQGYQLLAEELLPERMASAALLGALREVLRAADVRIESLHAMGVVNGPGSFTGLRVGLAVAKGLCEARGLALATVSRLAVLADAGELREGFAVLRAGRDQMYVRAQSDGGPLWERMMSVEAFRGIAQGRETVYAEAEVEALLGTAVRARRVPILAKDAVRPMRECLREGGSDLATVDANYVRDEGAIYRKAGRGDVPRESA